ncbi:hypothetical protein BJ912DRAFT_934425 [Pholiota molesta]|nr:hypothetical protein BJ912DRAFT_934425 [Pholiota molesta]
MPDDYLETIGAGLLAHVLMALGQPFKMKRNRGPIRNIKSHPKFLVAHADIELTLGTTYVMVTPPAPPSQLALRLHYTEIYGTADAVLQDDQVVAQVQPHFTNAQVQTIQGGSHALFYDNEGEFTRALIQFATKVWDGGNKTHS